MCCIYDGLNFLMLCFLIVILFWDGDIKFDVRWLNVDFLVLDFLIIKVIVLGVVKK